MRRAFPRTLSEGGILVAAAVGADAREFDAVAGELEFRHCLDLVFHRLHGVERKVVEPVAPGTSDVIMRTRISIEPLEGTSGVQLFDFFEVGEHFQIPINGAQADFREPLADDFVDFYSAGMRAELAELFQDDRPLFGGS